MTTEGSLKGLEPVKGFHFSRFEVKAETCGFCHDEGVVVQAGMRVEIFDGGSLRPNWSGGRTGGSKK